MNRNATSSLPCPTTRHHYASRALTDQRLPQVGGGGGVVGVPLQVLLQPEQEAVLQRYSGGRRASVEEAGGGVEEDEGLAELDVGYNDVKDDGACALAQALKANPTAAPRSLKVNANYIGRFGQVALTEALDMVAEMGGGREVNIVF